MARIDYYRIFSHGALEHIAYSYCTFGHHTLKIIKTKNNIFYLKKNMIIFRKCNF